jgi:hypothetical protein
MQNNEKKRLKESGSDDSIKTREIMVDLVIKPKMISAFPVKNSGVIVKHDQVKAR